MRRYRGEGLPEGGKIAVISNDALGNFVVLTPLLRMLRQQLQPSTIHYFSGGRTQELQDVSDLFEWNYPVHGASDAKKHKIAAERGPYDLIVNVERTAEAKAFASLLARGNAAVCGPIWDGVGNDIPFHADERGNLWSDPDWTALDITARFPFLQSPFIGEIFCRLCYLEGPIPRYLVAGEDPPFDTPPILISTAASLPEKLWPAEKWIEALKLFRVRGFQVGLLGAAPAQQRKFWQGEDGEEVIVASGLVQDLRGRLTLPHVMGALSKASLVLTIDNGILHLAVAASAPTIGLFRPDIHRLWAPPSDRLEVLIPEPSQLVASIAWEQVCDAISHAL